jgi:uncharacterized protein (DUF2267 family)
MRYDEFIDRVMQEAGVDARQDAIATVRATLAVLGERIYRTERDQLAAELPKPMKGFLCERAGPDVSREQLDRFGLDDFYQRVRAEAQLDYVEGARRAKVVVSILKEAVSEGTLADVRRDVGREYDPLFDEPGEGPAATRTDGTYPVEGAG